MQFSIVINPWQLRETVTETMRIFIVNWTERNEGKTAMKQDTEQTAFFFAIWCPSLPLSAN